MKLKMILVLAVLSLGFGIGASAEVQGGQGKAISLPHSNLSLDQGAFWFRQWNLKEHKGVSLSTIMNYDSALLMTFSGADYSYLNQQAGQSLKEIAPSQYQWSYSDDQVDYQRTYEVQGDQVLVNVAVQFKQKAPEKAYLNLVSRGLKDDHEARDRELDYFSNGKIERNKVDKSIDPTEVSVPVKWVGAGSRYFLFAILPQSGAPEKVLLQSTGDQTAQASMQFPVVGKQLNLKFKVIFMPKELETLRAVDPSLDTAVNFGFFTFIGYPILLLLKFIYKFVGNYGVAIILLTLLIKILTFPLVMKSMKGMRKMAEFQPKMKALQEKHKGDKQRFNQEMMVLMKSSGYNPMSGCFPMLIQMPIFFALYSVLYSAYELYHAPFCFWIHDLSAKDPYYITPVLMMLIMLLQQKLTPPSPGMDKTQQKLMRFMPVLFAAFMLAYPVGLCLYMLVNSVFSVLQQQFLNKKLGIGPTAGVPSPF